MNARRFTNVALSVISELRMSAGGLISMMQLQARVTARQLHPIRIPVEVRDIPATNSSNADGPVASRSGIFRGREVISPVRGRLPKPTPPYCAAFALDGETGRFARCLRRLGCVRRRGLATCGPPV